jgi:hypothetical protein
MEITEIKIIKKTQKTITFTNGIAKWRYSLDRFNRAVKNGEYKII